MPILPNPNITVSQAEAKAAMLVKVDAWAYNWVTHNMPDWLDELEQMAAVYNGNDVYHIMLRATGSPDISRFCQQAIRHIQRMNA